MKQMKSLEYCSEHALKIIYLSRESRENYIQAIHEAKESNWENVQKQMQKAHASYNSANTLLKNIYDLALEADYGNTLLLIQAETQVMETETIGIMTEEFIALIKTLLCDIYQKV